ncbi:MAG: CRISPR-associated helicase Cas3' [candidate division Zixibacteria bacterium]|nr:CRISPR-associated helicase Cas3' [candidate division Zixibacteria bacterium]
MFKAETVFWAKLNRKDSSYHPLICHMLDTANAAGVLWDVSFANALAANCSAASDENTKTVFAYWAGLHDIGKATPAFQEQSKIHEKCLKNAGFVFPSLCGQKISHGCLTEYIIRKSIQEENCNILKKQKIILKRIAIVLGGHHGKFPRDEDNRSIIAVGDNQWNTARSELINSYNNIIKSEAIYQNTASVFVNNSMLILLAGLTSVSDWIASNTDFFPYEIKSYDSNSLDLNEYFSRSQELAQKAISSLNWERKYSGDVIKGFAELFRDISSPNPLQVKVIEKAINLREKTMVIIEAPMGEGKTEAALYLANCMRTGCGNNGIYVALPTQATSDQMLDRVGNFLKASFPGDSINLHLLHGNSLFNKSYKEIIVRSVDCDGEHEASLKASEWFLPKKRTLLAPYGVGTVDQALISVLQTKHYFVRLFGLTNKVIILDEIHAYDTYTTTLIERLLEWLSSLNCCVILLSATLPKNKKHKLIKSFNPNIEQEQIPDSKYPAITIVKNRSIESITFESASGKEIMLRWIEPADLASRLSESLEDDGHIAVICNTVGKAQAVFQEIENDERFSKFVMRLLHARFPFRRRRELADEVIGRFGKKQQPKGPSILVSTQIIEQSLDIDFDLMITELAPVDLILQRMGRLHRHDKDRPSSLRKPELWIIKPEIDKDGKPDFGGSGCVYDKFILYKTYLTLKSLAAISIPDDLQTLVESVYDEDSGHQELSRNEKDTLSNFYDEYLEDINKLEEIAKNCLIRPPSFNGNILTEYFQDLLEDDPDAHPMRQALTRYGPQSIKAICLHSTDNSKDHPALHEEPDFNMTRKLILDSVPISHPAIVRWLKNQEFPKAWQKQSALRNYKYLIFHYNICDIKDENIRLTLDDKLGLTITKIE